MTTQNTATARPDLIARWLFICAAFVLLMVVVGGITRLTNSGLSMTEWEPLVGAVPPMSDGDWAQRFAQYQTTSQFRLMNAGMSMAAFKSIFYWEYAHRLLGRLLGLLFGLPLIWLLIKRQVPRALIPRLIILFALGGAQGLVGWLMVLSGLKDRINVEPVMLAAHLSLALLLLAAILWTALDCRAQRSARPTALGGITLGLLTVQIVYGGLTAGLRAGGVTKQWPLMNGRFFPAGVDWSHGVGTALINDPLLVHFIHRWWAWIALLGLLLLARRAKPLNRRASIAIHATVGLQIILGIGTVQSGVLLPLAALHQFNGALTLCAAIWGAHVVGSRPPAISTI